MINGNFSGPNRNFTYSYGTKSGENGKAAGYKVNVENKHTGVEKTFSGGIATNGEHTVAGRSRYNHDTGRGAVNVAHKGPDGFQRATAVTGPNGTAYRVAKRDDSGELLGVWKGYTAK